jgi:adenylate cyclase
MGLQTDDFEQPLSDRRPAALRLGVCIGLYSAVCSVLHRATRHATGMPRIFFLPDQRYVEASDLETVLSASLRVGIPITNECRGNARCSTCRVLVLNGLGHCSPRSEKERALAEQLHFSDRVRLACQTTITGNVTMRRLILDAEDAGLTDQRREATAHGLVGEERQIAILFVDVRDSTSFAESVPPFDVIHILRRFYHHMDKAVDNGGHIACYAGDGLMALFGIESSECAPSKRCGPALICSIPSNGIYSRM